jgi:hypothetical protein
LLGFLGNMGQIEQYAVHRWVCFKNSNEKTPVATTNIDNVFEHRERIFGQHGGVEELNIVSHRQIKSLGRLWMFSSILPDIRTVDVTERRFSRAHGVHYLTHGLVGLISHGSEN